MLAHNPSPPTTQPRASVPDTLMSPAQPQLPPLPFWPTPETVAWWDAAVRWEEYRHRRMRAKSQREWLAVAPWAELDPQMQAILARAGVRHVGGYGRAAAWFCALWLGLLAATAPWLLAAAVAFAGACLSMALHRNRQLRRSLTALQDLGVALPPAIENLKEIN